MTVRLTKHHGLGNDFLVHLTDDPRVVGDPRWADRARAWCHRRTGIGADGLIVGGLGAAAPAGADLRMVLHNADGSVAEISGNGLRCLVQAEARRRGSAAGTLVVETGGGRRTVDYEATDDPLVLVGRADMGPATAGPAPDHDLDLDGTPGEADDPDRARALALDATDSRTLDLGNPHLVLVVADPGAVDIAAAGPLHEARYDGGINVHAVAPAPGEADAIDLVIWERGVGVTLACGTGATAAARAAFDLGLVGRHVTVHMPGGDVAVEVGDPMVLRGPAAYVAALEVEDVAGEVRP